MAAPPLTWRWWSGHREAIAPQALFESLANVAIGYGIAVVTQIVVLKCSGLRNDLSDDLAIGAVFTVVSNMRSYTPAAPARGRAGIARRKRLLFLHRPQILNSQENLGSKSRPCRKALIVSIADQPNLQINII